jgi:ABC-type nitrate/sulfonate/bicarbonate transport system substrate-binding protein
MIKISKRTLIISVVLILSILIIVYALTYYIKPVKNENTSPLPKIKVGYKLTNLDSVPIILAYEKGYFRDQGIDVELIQVSGSDAPVAVVSQQVDLVVAGAPRFYSPIEKGAPVRIISPISTTRVELLVRPLANITTFKDLEGKKVSYGTGKSTNELLLRYILAKENVDLKKVNFLELDNQYLHTMLMEQKSLDAIFISDAGYVDAAEKLGAVIMPAWKDSKYEKESSSGTIIAANTDFLNNNEEITRAFFRGVIEADSYLKSNLNESVIIVTKFYRDNSNGAVDFKSEELKSLIDQGKVSYYLWEDPFWIVGMAQTSSELNITKHALSIDELYDLRFKDMLKSAQNEIYGQKTN